MPVERLVALEDFVRLKAGQFLAQPGVSSIGVAYREEAGIPTDELVIRFAVVEKLEDDELHRAGRVRLPESFDLPSGDSVATQVVVRQPYASDVQPPEAMPERVRRQDPVRPGISISGDAAGAGTIGAIVFDQTSGQPLALSNWHVLQGPGGLRNGPVFQPGLADIRGQASALLGHTLRGFADVDGDVAVASIEGRAHATDVLGLDGCVPRELVRAQLGDRVCKSGRTTGVTRGRVQCVGMVCRVSYDGESRLVSGHEIGPDPAHPSASGEISAPGDSGSVWLRVDPASDEPTDAGVGLQFGGEAHGATEEYALACDLARALDGIGASLTPDVAWTPPPPAPRVPAGTPPWDTFGALAHEGAAPEAGLDALVPPPAPSSVGLVDSPPPLSSGPAYRPMIGILAAVAVFSLIHLGRTYGFTLASAPLALLDSLTAEGVGRVFVLLSFVALLTERAMVLALNVSRGAEAAGRRARAERRRAYVRRVRVWVATAQGASEEESAFWRDLLGRQKSMLVLEERSFEDYRTETRDVALCASAAIGLLLALSGVRAIAPLLQGTAQLGFLFHALDTFLTAGLVAGGSEGVHQVASAFTSSMKARKRENEGRASGAL